MNIFVGNTSKYFFPIFTINSSYYSDYFALLFIVIHIMLTLLCCLLTIQVCIIVKSIRVFHTNMSTIIIVILGQWFEIVVAKIILFPYQLGFITIGNPKMFQFWISNDPKEMPQAEKTADLTPLFITTCEILNFTTGVAISGIFIIGAVLIYFIILHINIGIQKRLDDHDKQQNYYSLAIRFQAKENARSLELAKKVVLFAAFAILCGMALLIATAMHWADEYISTIVTLAEAAFNLNPLFIVPVGMYSVPTWRDKFFKTTPILQRIQKIRSRKNIKVSDTIENEAAKESEIYFNQLSAAWK
ncbi:hypothetical protein GCK72_003734 [Caenorhabditis remanei]|uniref:Uncharacterized protein n=1 Tax=Caenorhabditis remanei TaxID=31234 RepID=A0A6A5H9S9_CAERE|nr:hypothetical protein GCK72_003734 [Caenorhabditis remanei]KAF1763789.1 hypothetical protein GCK72_003734 [Caenorhabditis remanei]